ncbi:DUF4395 domain-containing protein [Nocardioides ochotonae]|uniref:DUF4395 domain-containing protein n=1 Tax=Nocardioides ochotonae TaxID=2685869 RepID=UPI00140B6BC5|nr:DUF4395 domain-containing protein [Nocardioides ochotonae]
MSTTASTPTRVAETRLDPRGPQFSAAVTALLLLVVLVAPTGVATVLVAVQAALFALGALRGVQHTPTAWAFRTWVRPRLAPPSDLEDARPPRFAQAVGLGFALVALVGFLAGAELLGQVATGFALVAALLNALFRFCLGCELYLLLRRLAPRPS